MHLIIEPAPIVGSSVIVGHRALSRFSIIFKISLIVISIRPFKLSSPVFFIICIQSSKHCSIWPLLFPLPTALIFNPLAFISGPVSGNVFPTSMSFIIFPLSNKNISIRMVKTTSSFSFIVHELPVICTFIWEIEFPNAVPLTSKPLPKVIKIFGQFEGAEYKGAILIGKFGRCVSLIDCTFELYKRSGKLI